MLTAFQSQLEPTHLVHGAQKVILGLVIFQVFLVLTKLFGLSLMTYLMNMLVMQQMKLLVFLKAVGVHLQLALKCS
jgi:hypothetical protein